MSSRLVNVRLDEERLRKAKKLRESGISLSELVRDAIDGRFEELNHQTPRRDAIAILKSIEEKYPMPADAQPLGYSVHDRHQASEAIRQRLVEKHKRDAKNYRETTKRRKHTPQKDNHG